MHTAELREKNKSSWFLRSLCIQVEKGIAQQE